MLLECLSEVSKAVVSYQTWSPMYFSPLLSNSCRAGHQKQKRGRGTCVEWKEGKGKEKGLSLLIGVGVGGGEPRGKWLRLDWLSGAEQPCKGKDMDGIFKTTWPGGKRDHSAIPSVAGFSLCSWIVRKKTNQPDISILRGGKLLGEAVSQVVCPIIVSWSGVCVHCLICLDEHVTRRIVQQVVVVVVGVKRQQEASLRYVPILQADSAQLHHLGRSAYQPYSRHTMFAWGNYPILLLAALHNQGFEGDSTSKTRFLAEMTTKQNSFEGRHLAKGGKTTPPAGKAGFIEVRSCHQWELLS